MLIKLIAENEAEEARLNGEEREIQGVNEYLFFGNREDEEGNQSEFHEWHGNHKYLMSNLQWFYEIVNDERKTTANASGNRMIKRSTLPPDKQKIETVSTKKPIQFPKNEDVEDAEEIDDSENITLDDE